MARVLDFDQARRDTRSAEGREPAVLRAFGRQFPIPSSVPLGFIMFSQELQQRRPDGRYTQSDTIDLLRHAVGRSVFEALTEEGLEPEDVGTLLELVRQAWTDEDGDEGEAPAPA